jgi:glycosyltransferase involved in cell wall biosynthesis
MPLISILLPTYNAAQYIEQAVCSVLKQSFLSYELIILDDGSIDTTKKIVQPYAKDTRLKYIRRKHAGLIANLNYGLRIAQGKYIARIDADDVWLDKHKLKKQMAFLTKNQDYVLVGTQAYGLNENGNIVKKFHYPVTDQAIRNKFLLKNPFIHSAVLFKRTLAKYDQSDLYVEDYGLWLRLAQQGKVANLPDYCVGYQLSADSITKKNNRKQIINSLMLVTRYRKSYSRYGWAVLKWLSEYYIRMFFS